ncbi:gamma-glutamylcyclotransferase [Columba livia]|uniref:gamma-glutamylcyclotransferase n=1 Tax=Columba livia TaxID=8932 RepID=A0A2I0MRH5_COLLI|nr:gamma-glutamylcyclotransferase [Columba livia]
MPTAFPPLLRHSAGRCERSRSGGTSNHSPLEACSPYLDKLQEGNVSQKDFKLEFGHHQGRTSSVWHGGTATIVQSPGDEVWGIVWKMNTSNLSSLDKQEGVEGGIYVPIEVNVHTDAGKVLTCRSYQMKDYVCGPPSPQYKKVICMGAKQNGLPADYQKNLEAIETNNYAGLVPIMEEIEAAIKAKKIKSA